MKPGNKIKCIKGFKNPRQDSSLISGNIYTVKEVGTGSHEGKITVAEIPGYWWFASNFIEAELYLVEFYQKGPKGETGWDIQFAWVRAYGLEHIVEQLKQHVPAKFDEVITYDRQSQISPLAMKKAPIFLAH